MAKERAMNVFDVLKSMDRGDYSFYGSVRTEAAKKELDSSLGLPLLRWMSGAERGDEAEYALCAVNDIANEHYFDYGKHKELQAKLLTASGARMWVKHVWINMPKTKRLNVIYDELVKLYPDMDHEDLDLWLDLNGKDELIAVATTLGLQKEERKKLMDEYDAYVKSRQR